MIVSSLLYLPAGRQEGRVEGIKIGKGETRCHHPHRFMKSMQLNMQVLLCAL
jgi:hypothetical protein